MKSITFIRRILFGWKTAGSFFIAIATFCNVSSIAMATTLTFEPGDGTITIPGVYFGFIPEVGAVQYVEKGMTVDVISSGGGIFELNAPGSTTGNSLGIFTTDGPPPILIIRFSFGGAPFDVLSTDTNMSIFDFDETFVSSLGSVVKAIGTVFPPMQTFPVNRHIDFTQIVGWSGITSFTMSIRTGFEDVPFSIDNLVFQPSSVPEPSTLVLLMLGLAALIGWRRANR